MLTWCGTKICPKRQGFCNDCRQVAKMRPVVLIDFRTSSQSQTFACKKLCFGIIVNVIALGIVVVAAQYLGAKQVDKAEDTIVTGITGNFIIGIVLSLIVILIGKKLLLLIGTDALLLDDAVTYLRIVGFSLVFIALRVALSNGFRSFGKPKLLFLFYFLYFLRNFANRIFDI